MLLHQNMLNWKKNGAVEPVTDLLRCICQKKRRLRYPKLLSVIRNKSLLLAGYFKISYTKIQFKECVQLKKNKFRDLSLTKSLPHKTLNSVLIEVILGAIFNYNRTCFDFQCILICLTTKRFLYR